MAFPPSSQREHLQTACQKTFANLLRLWGDFCLELRRIAMAFRQQRLIVAAMLLAFAGAVEQNLLGFDAELVRRVQKAVREEKAVSFNPEIVAHLQAMIGEIA